MRPPASYHALATLLMEWFSVSARSLPWRHSNDPYQTLISEFMLQQTQVVTVIPYFQRWIQAFPTFESLATATEPDVLRAWEGLGYYSRARNLHRAAQEVVARHNGQLPADTAAIRALPGVGPYTAGAIASFAFNLPEPAIDANVQRVLARIFNVREEISTAAAKSKLDTHARNLLAAANPEYRAINAATMELGALICTSGRPACQRCPIRESCANQGNAADLPVKRRKAKPTAIDEFALWDINPEGILLELRTGPRWRNLWTLPTIAPPSTPVTPLLVHRFAVTRFQISLHILPSSIPTKKHAPTRESGLHRIPLSHLRNLPLAAPHRRVVDTLSDQLDLNP